MSQPKEPKTELIKVIAEAATKVVDSVTGVILGGQANRRAREQGREQAAQGVRDTHDRRMERYYKGKREKQAYWPVVIIVGALALIIALSIIKSKKQ